MKNILPALFCLCGSTAFGQSGLFIQPQAGIGVSNVKTVAQNDTKNATVYDWNLGVGYKFKNFVVMSGIGYLETGYKLTITYMDALGNPISTAGYYTYFSHIVIPVTVAHEFKPGKKLSVLPAIGALISYNMSGRQTLPNYMGSSNIEPIPSEQFNKDYKAVSLFGVAQLNFDYKISPQMSVTLAPVIDYMFTNMLKALPGAPGNSQQNNYAFMCNAGIKWYFEKEKKPVK